VHPTGIGARISAAEYDGPPPLSGPYAEYHRVMPESDLSSLTVLGSPVRGPIEHVESFPAPATLTKVRFTTDEVTSVCPVTGQPDISGVSIEYEPHEQCIESKSLKLYLWSFRDRAIFAEALAAEIAAEVQRATAPRSVRVVVTQHARGGIVTEATVELPGRE
jgi:7-cyano-7-deazaguanine reductase